MLEIRLNETFQLHLRNSHSVPVPVPGISEMYSYRYDMYEAVLV